MVAFYEVENAITSLNPAEALSAAAGIEEFSSKLRNGEIKKLPDMLLAFAASSEGLDQMVIDADKVKRAVNIIAGCTMLEACEFTQVLKERPEYNPVQP